GLTLPHYLKVKGRTCKRVLREVAKRKLPFLVANKPKHGFGIPVDTWVDASFRARLKDILLGSTSRLPEFFQPEVYSSMVEAFCNRHLWPGLSRQALYQRVIALLTVQLMLVGKPDKHANVAKHYNHN